MPNRIVREGIIDSRAVNSLSEPGEILYRRLMSVVDDYGRYEADPQLLRGKCFSRQLDRWPISRISAVIEELGATPNDDGFPLVLVYKIGNKSYLELSNFNQRLRSKISRYPAPTARHALEGLRSLDGEVLTDDGHSHADDGHMTDTCSPSRSRLSSAETETNAEASAQTHAELRVCLMPASSPPSLNFDGWWSSWSAVRGTNHRMQAQNAYFRLVTAENDAACLECTRSYLRSLENPGKGYNPENFLEQQALDMFGARWPARASRASPSPTAAQAKRAELVAGMQWVDQVRRGQ